MNQTNTLEPQMASSFSIIPENGTIQSSINLTPSEFAKNIKTISDIDISYDQLIDICQEKELWILPLDGDKRPYIPNWNSEKIDYEFIRQELKTGTAKAIGLVTGEVSDDIICLDFDGVDEEFAKEYIFTQEMPPTIIITSGKKGHFSLLFRVKEPTTRQIVQNTLNTRKVVKLDIPSTSKPDKKAEIEIRWNKHQCVIWGTHPEKGNYKTRGERYFHNCEIAELPFWLYHQIITLRNQKSIESPTPNRRSASLDNQKSIDYQKSKSQKDGEHQVSIDYQIDYEAFSENDTKLLEKILTCLSLITEDDCADHDSWFEITAALKYEALEHPDIESEIQEIWDLWSSNSGNYNEQENYTRWNSLNDTSDNAITLGTVIAKYCGGWKQVLARMKELFPGSFASNDNCDENVDSVSPPINFQSKKININTRLFGYIETMLLDDLWFNLHTRRFEIDGKEYKNVDFIRYLSSALNHAVSQNLFAQVIEKYEEDKSYHPFERYLQTLWDINIEPSDDDISWANKVMSELVTDIMKVKDDEFAVILVKKWLVGLVSRVLTPGIKFDHVLTLVGGKGLGKTSFFEKITGEDYYSPHTGSLNDKDTLMKCHKKIVVELGEVEAVFRKTDIEEMKCFITTREDDFRIPYGCESLRHKRRFVLGASANSGDFLREPDGNRRFWIIKITDKIDFLRLETERDTIMRAACILRAAGEKIYLSDEETTINNGRNKLHVDIPLLEEAELILAGAREIYSSFKPNYDFSKPFLTTDLADALSNRFPHVKATARFVNNALKALGYEQRRATYQGKRRNYWFKEE